MACISLSVALSGVGYAAVALPRNSVGAAQLKANAVTAAKVKDRSLKAIDFGLGQLPAGAQGPQGLAGPAGAGGPEGPAGATGPRGPSDVWLRANSVDLPAGRYAIWGRGYVNNGSASEFRLSSGLSGSFGGSTFLGNAHVPAGKEGSVPVLASITLSAAATITLNCGTPPTGVTIGRGIMAVAVETIR